MLYVIKHFNLKHNSLNQSAQNRNKMYGKKYSFAWINIALKLCN